MQVKCFAGEEAPKYAPDFFAASCKGFWSGIFGHRVSCFRLFHMLCPEGISGQPAHLVRLYKGAGFTCRADSYADAETCNEIAER